MFNFASFLSFTGISGISAKNAAVAVTMCVVPPLCSALYGAIRPLNMRFADNLHKPEIYYNTSSLIYCLRTLSCKNFMDFVATFVGVICFPLVVIIDTVLFIDYPGRYIYHKRHLHVWKKMFPTYQTGGQIS